MKLLVFILFALNLSHISNVNARFLINTSSDLDHFDDEPNKHARIARFVVHKSEWASIGTISTEKHIKGLPMVNVISVADSPKGAPSTGNIYYYLTNLDFTGKDLLKDNKLTIMFTNDQDLSCHKKGIDSMEPTCPRVIISGSAFQLDKDNHEFKFANESVFSHHPAADNWLKNHNFFLSKVNITQIIVLDGYGGANYVTPEDYFRVKLDDDFDISESKSFLQDDNNDVNELSNDLVQSIPITDNSKINIRIDKRNNVVNIEM